MENSTDSFFTQMPNGLLDALMSKDINNSLSSVLMVIARKTYGFHKKSDEISLSQFQKYTKFSRPTVVSALEKLKLVKLVVQVSKGRSKYASSEWKIDYSNWEEKLVKLAELVKNTQNHVASSLVKSPLHTKESQNKNYNYLKKSISTKGENPGGGTEPRPRAEIPTAVIYVSLIKSLRQKLEAEYGVAKDFHSLTYAFLYYLRRYEKVCGVEHPRYKIPQLYDCMTGFYRGILLIEQANLTTNDILARTINQWFETTDKDQNNLRLSHFAGRGASIFFKCLETIFAEEEIHLTKEDYVNS